MKQNIPIWKKYRLFENANLFKPYVDCDTGLVCQVTQHQHFIHLCGYITIPGHLFVKIRNEIEDSVPIHGGWTYIGTEEYFGRIGFHCAHDGDWHSHVVGTKTRYGITLQDATPEDYKDHDFVTSELKRACKDIASMLSAHERLELLRKAKSI